MAEGTEICMLLHSHPSLSRIFFDQTLKSCGLKSKCIFVSKNNKQLGENSMVFIVVVKEKNTISSTYQ